MKNLLFLSFTLISISLFSQTGFELVLEPVTINNIPGLQSFARASYNGKWVLIGGRTDGLHRRQPWASFDVAGKNTAIYVVDPMAGSVSSAPLSSLSLSIQEQLSSTNMNFFQQDTVLIITGGYGYSNTATDHITYPYITAVHLPSLIDHIENSQSIASDIVQQTDQRFAVTGGYLEMVADTFYLVGGHRFDGPYNPMGPNHGPGFVQTYTNSIKKFTVSYSAASIAAAYFDEMVDTVNLHRRDYNLLPQVFPNGEEGLTAFSGVFQYTQNIPWTNSVDITSSGYTVNNTFNQYLNHYHTASAAIYDSTYNDMHSIFFGGISQYTLDANGNLVNDTEVPFTKTISRVTRFADGSMTESYLEEEMPGYLGTSAEFFLADGIPLQANKIIRLDKLTQDTTHIGYIVGGIESTDANIFFINDGTQSTANTTVFKVYLIKNDFLGTNQITANQEKNEFLVYPNPARDEITISYLNELSADEVILTDSKGTIVKRIALEKKNRKGKTKSNLNLSGIPSGIYYVSLRSNEKIITRKLIIQ